LEPVVLVLDLRHHLVTEAFKAGGGAPTVRDLAGHGHMDVTARDGQQRVTDPPIASKLGGEYEEKIVFYQVLGGVAEWSKAAVLKTADVVRHPKVRILSPPLKSLEKSTEPLPPAWPPGP
jgi:hypothetical protein